MASSEVHAVLCVELNRLRKDDIIEVLITLTLPEKMANPIVTEYVKNLKLALAQYTENDEDYENDSNSSFDTFINGTVGTKDTGFIKDSQVDTSQGKLDFNREELIKLLEFKIGVLDDTVVETKKTDADMTTS
ncbi:hypothetical protein HHI36_001411 [Cryptolaemus montrouzieri]|uniref:Uncharacterized protein n=1 Tax=Cryptolaemus montrouzieri TaxID=559131 RepID=A0ABD2P8D3_9CUCU